jgi:tRNA(fMet)-specific endonuclease VapC
MRCITIAGSAYHRREQERLSVFMAKLEGMPFDDQDAELAGAIRARLERAGKPIGAYDTLMAGQALRRGMTLVTANLAEFGHVAGLRWENWAAGEPADRPRS